MSDFSLRQAGYQVVATYEPCLGGFSWGAVFLREDQIVDQARGILGFLQIDGREPEAALRELLVDHLEHLPQ